MKFNKITYGLISACGLAMTLTACQNDNDLGGVASGNFITVPVSTVITVPDGDDTRTTLNELAGNLQWKWEKGDQVVAIDMLTGVRGYLTAGEPTNDGKTAPFSGSIDFQEGATSAKLAIIYLGKGVDPASLGDELKIDLSEQDGKFESLVTRDVLWTGSSQSKAVDVVINPSYTVINDFTLTHKTSAGHFQLKIKDGETINNADVTITGTSAATMYGVTSYSIKAGNQFSENTTANGVINTTTGDQGDFYVTLLPKTKIALKFVATYKGVEYTGYLGGSDDFTFKLAAGQFLRAENETYGPLVIEMTNSFEYKLSFKGIGLEGGGVNETGEAPEAMTWPGPGEDGQHTFILPTLEGCTLSNGRHNEFIGWMCGEEHYLYDFDNPDSNTITLTKESPTKTLTVFWRTKKVPFKVSYCENYEGHTNVNTVTTGSQTMTLEPTKANYTITKADPVRAGYHFAGWYDNKECTGKSYQKGDVYEVVEDTESETMYVTFYAKWSKIETYTLKFDANVGSDIDVSGMPQEMSEESWTDMASFELPTDKPTADKGLTFVGWSTSKDGEVITATTLEVSEKSTTLYAIWKQETPSTSGNGGNLGGFDPTAKPQN